MTAPAPAAPLNLLQATEQAFAQAGRGQLSIIGLFDAAAALTGAGHASIAVDLYRAWLAKTASPLAYAVQFNLGVLLSDAADPAGAEAAYRAALAQKPDFPQALLNLGTLLETSKRPDEALAAWREVLECVDQQAADGSTFYLQALNNLGRLLEIRKQLPEAEAMLLRSLQLDPAQANVMTHWVHLRQKQCEWPVYPNIDGIKLDDMIAGTSALAMLSASDDPALQLATSQRYVADKVLKNVRHLSRRQSYGHQRLRIGYLSSDFCSHAVSILTAELYGLHDRTQVEVFGFCWSHEDGSPLRARVIAGMDHHIRIGALSDEQAALLIRSHEIDILVDLHGLTLGTRHDILSYRPAPIQVTWLGFPGPTGLPEIDYVVSDPFVLPSELEPFFTEKPLHMPHTFQINDRQRTIGPRTTRAACGLPEDAFVFCSFNNTFKVTPEVFAAWMRILRRVPGSVLWLVADHEHVRENLLRQADVHGVERARLLFATRVPPAEYLARFQVADLFLDTFPFGAGTTASDALWAGLPLLTYAGKVFASRMAGSTLRAVGLPELIAADLGEYEEKAVALGLDRVRTSAMRRHLEEGRATCALFDSAQFVRDLELRFRALVDALPAPPPAPTAAELAYIMRPGGAPNAELQPQSGERRYVIFAPPYQHNSAGIRVMYDLQKWLIRAGEDAIVCTWFEGYPVEQFADDIVIYPEVAPGNLAGAKRVIRFILNVPGKLGHGEKTYASNETLVAYNDDLTQYSGGAILQVPSVESFFRFDDTPKTIDAVYVGKGQDLLLHPPGCVYITKTFPATRRDMARLLRGVKTLYLYDDFTMIAYEAALCGCEVRLISKDGTIGPAPDYFIPSMDQFKVQLHEFIAMSKRL